jgi:hypothetical protein
VKKIVQRHQYLRPYVRLAVINRRDAVEISVRMMGMRSDVDRALRQFPPVPLLTFLRKHGIDGTCPQWLIDGLTSSVLDPDDWATLDLLSPN